MARSVWSRIPKSWLVLGVAGTAILLYLAASWYWIPTSSSPSPPGFIPPPTGTTVRVVDVDLIPDYWTGTSSDSHYLTSAYCYDTDHPGCASSSGLLLLPNCPSDGCANVTPGASFSYNLTLVDNDTVSHEIINITVGAPLTFLGLSPAVPYTLGPGTPTTFSITIGTPDSPGEYDLTGVVNTS